MKGIVKITPMWKVLTTCSLNFPQAKITTFTVYSNLPVAQLTCTFPHFQVEACVKEAERIEYLIQTDSPLLKSYMTLSPLLLAPMRAPSSLDTSGASPRISQSVSSIALFILVYHIVTSKLSYSWDFILTGRDVEISSDIESHTVRGLAVLLRQCLQATHVTC